MISLPNTLLQEVDGIVSKEKVNRSYLIREAMCMYISEMRKRQIREKLQDGYIEMSNINLLLANEAVQAENEAVETIEWDRILYTRIVCVKGNDILNAHIYQLFQCQRAV